MNDLDGHFDPDFLTPPPRDHDAAVWPPNAPLRCYEVAMLRPDGTIFVDQQMVPANPVFDSAFSALDGSALVTTSQCQVAIADLQPGEMIGTIGGGMAKVVWIGSTQFVPANTGHRLAQMRIMPDAFGAGCPAAPLTAGPGAHVLLPDPLPQEGQALVPLRHLIDRDRVIEVTPPTPVRLFHLCLERHALIDIQGLPMASYHPDSAYTEILPPALTSRFRAMFPPMGPMSDFGATSPSVAGAKLAGRAPERPVRA